MKPDGVLGGWGILIVEDDPLIALDLEQIVKGAGGRVVGPTGRVSKARELVARERPDAAVLDVRLASGDTLGLADELLRCGIPFLFQTSDRSAVNERHGGAVILAEPFRPEQLIDALIKLLANRC
ncbi:MAG TPA: response regulator [Reyranella sp.]|nr:response regulator [Reyranella sp.]